MLEDGAVVVAYVRVALRVRYLASGMYVLNSIKTWKGRVQAKEPRREKKKCVFVDYSNKIFY